VDITDKEIGVVEHSFEHIKGEFGGRGILIPAMLFRDKCGAFEAALDGFSFTLSEDICLRTEILFVDK